MSRIETPGSVGLRGVSLRVAGVLAGLAVAGMAAGFVAGCDGQEEVRVYTLPASEPETYTPPPVHAHTHEHQPGGGGAGADAGAGAPVASRPASVSAAPVEWDVPEGWRLEEEPRPMRHATFFAGEGGEALEIVVSVFPGEAGGLVANVNRWRQQMGLGAADEAELARTLERFENSGVEGHTMRFGDVAHLCGAVIREPGADRTWFVKAVGTAEQIERHADEIEEFSRSFRSAGAGG